MPSHIWVSLNRLQINVFLLSGYTVCPLEKSQHSYVCCITQCFFVAMLHSLVHRGKMFWSSIKMMLLASVFLSVVPLFFHIMSAHHEVHAHVEKKGLPHIQKYFSLSPTLFSLSLSNSHAYRNSCACLRAYTLRRARRRARPQTVSCVLPTASSTKTEHTACPCLTHIYTHRPMCTHKLWNSPLHTLKGTWHKLTHYISSASPVPG